MWTYTPSGCVGLGGSCPVPFLLLRWDAARDLKIYMYIYINIYILYNIYININIHMNLHTLRLCWPRRMIYLLCACLSPALRLPCPFFIVKMRCCAGPKDIHIYMIATGVPQSFSVSPDCYKPSNQPSLISQLQNGGTIAFHRFIARVEGASCENARGTTQTNKGMI